MINGGRSFPTGAAWVNLYGATETTLVKSYYEVPARSTSEVLPIGRALPQTQLLVLRNRSALCGFGERGEIAIRTPYRSLGYCNLEEETRARFITNPFTDDPSDVIYLTGDCGAYRPDGTVQLFGRVDDQIKINGVRIEPAEAAAALSKFSGLGDVPRCCRQRSVKGSEARRLRRCATRARN